MPNSKSALPTIEIEDENGVGYLVLCWEDARHDLDEFIYEPGLVYALIDRKSEVESFIYVVGYEFLTEGEMRAAIAEENLQVELVIRTVTEKGEVLVASPRLTRYRFPACLDHDLSPDRFLIEALEETIVETGNVPLLENPASIRPAAVKVVQKAKKAPIDLTHTNLGKTKKITPKKEIAPKKEVARSAIVPASTSKKETLKPTQIAVLRPVPVPVPVPIQLPIRTDDALRVQRVLHHWVEIAKANTDDDLKWANTSISSDIFQIMKGEQLILKFDRNSRILSTDLTTELLKSEFISMANGVMCCQLETLPIHETARHIFLRSTSFTQSSIYDFLMHMLSIKKVGSYTKTRA
jgi:hypothetical protein